LSETGVSPENLVIKPAGAVLLGRAARLTVDDEVAVYLAECDEREFGSEV